MLNSPLLVIVGPTAVGKTALSLKLTRDRSIEIISADSRQVYRRCDIGTAKPSAAELKVAPHHLINVVEPYQVMTLAEFQDRAYQAIDQIQQRNRLPVVVGGTGQWVRAVVEGWGIPRVSPDMALRAELEARAAQEGAVTLHTELAEVDPPAAAKIDSRNLRRVIRALEVYYKTGVPISDHQRKTAPPYDVLQIGLTMSREDLYRRIDVRVDQMMAAGLLAEVRSLAEAGYGWELPSMMALGYKQIGQHLRGEVNLEEAVALIKKETRRFVRQQYTWFRLDDPQIHWFNAAGDDVVTSVRGLVTGWYAQS
jgi:tRNA dimethylallyltransferase